MSINKYKLMLIAFVLSVTAIYGAGRWGYTGDLVVGNSGFECVGFPDGRIMIMGGLNETGYYQIYQPSTGKWTRTALPSGSSHDLGILLYNGKVLYLDGNDFWFFQPDSNNWRSAGISYPAWTGSNCYTLLKDGRVLILYDGQNCVLYDYNSNTVSPTGATSADHSSGIEVLLPNGNVLIAGGWVTTPKVCEIYNTSAGVWSLTDSMAVGRTTHAGVLFPPPWSKVLMTGDDEPSELYDWGAGTWASTDTMADPSATILAMALLPDGRALAAGGVFDLTTCRIFDPQTEQWTTVDPMNLGRDHFSLSILYTGKILAMGVHSTSWPVQCEIYDPSNGAWQTKSTPLGTARQYATTTALPIIHTSNCSTNVLITGGENAAGTALSSCELYNYSQQRMAFTTPLNTARTHHTAVLLGSASGEVLAAGGKNGGGALNSCEIFNVTTEIWNSTGVMTNARFDHSATLLMDGRVLVTGGEGTGYLNGCEVFNAGTWSSTGTMNTPRARHCAILLLDGKVMVVGGETTGGTPTNTCEIWDGNTWTSAAPMKTARSLHTAALLQSGKVLVVGGKRTGGTALDSCEIYDPVLNTWTQETSLNTARYGHNSILLYSGIVLVTGGTDGTNYLASTELWDPAAKLDRATGKHGWTISGNLGAGRAYHASILIPYLKPFVYTFGGYNGTSCLSSVEEHDFGLGYRDIWQSTITNYKSVTRITSNMNMTGTLLRGLSEADGGNYCHVASNDHPIISLVRTGGGNWQGNGGGEIMLMPHSVSWDSAHTNVTGLPNIEGYYRLWSIVNGIPCKWDWNCIAGQEEQSQKSTNLNPQLKVYPNPATTKTGVNFELSGIRGEQNASVQIYDLSGRLIKKLTTSSNQKNSVTTIWKGTDDNGKEVKVGIYFYSIKNKDVEYKGKFTIFR